MLIKTIPDHKLITKRGIFEKFKHQPVSSISKPRNIDLQPLGITLTKKMPKQLLHWRKNTKKVLIKKSVTPSKEIQYSSALLTYKLDNTSYFPKINKFQHQQVKQECKQIQHNTLNIEQAKKHFNLSQDEQQYDKNANPGPGSYLTIDHSQRQNNIPHSNFISKVNRFSQHHRDSPDKFYNIISNKQSNKPSFPFTKSFKQDKQNISLDIGYYDTRQGMKDNVIRSVIRNLQIQRYNNPQQRKQKSTLRHQPKPTKHQMFNILHNSKQHSYYTTTNPLQGW